MTHMYMSIFRLTRQTAKMSWRTGTLPVLTQCCNPFELGPQLELEASSRRNIYYNWNSAAVGLWSSHSLYSTLALPGQYDW